ncbi:hypothetical protein [Herbaspirillum camelliae]|uniref:hypothetical protein n=1 Tax=Herbaspirillum camelliae TaxID=1892903 RepID=UPI00094A0BE1|nr:hypothetical protein [Herbaspirillum camelliae]
MRKKRQHEGMQAELVAALGLVWGLLNAYQYEEAYALSRGCLLLWPDDEKLRLMHDFAAAEVLEPVDQQRLRSMRTPHNAAWVDLVLRRLQYAQDNRAPA